MGIPGILTKTEINTCCKNLLLGLERRKIERFEDLEKWMNLSFDVPKKTHRVETRKIENQEGTTYRISYIIPGKGFPLEIELDPARNYTVVVVKGDFNLDRYEGRRKDLSGNTVNCVIVEKCSIDTIRAELGYIVNASLRSA